MSDLPYKGNLQVTGVECSPLVLSWGCTVGVMASQNDIGCCMGCCWFVSTWHICDGWRRGNARQYNNLFLFWSRRAFYFCSKEINSLCAFIALLLRPWVLFVFLRHFKFSQLNLEVFLKNYDGKHFPSCFVRFLTPGVIPDAADLLVPKIGVHSVKDSVWNPNASGHK